MTKLIEFDFSHVRNVIKEWHEQYGIKTSELDLVNHTSEYLKELPEKLHSTNAYCLIAHRDFFIKTPQDM